MSKDIVIIGAGGFGREVRWLIERLNEYTQETDRNSHWKIKGFIDDAFAPGTQIDGLAVIGGIDKMLDIEQTMYVTCAIATSKTRKNIIEHIVQNTCLIFPNLIDPSVICSNKIALGQGNTICAGTILTVGIQLKDFVILNLDCTVGHDVFMDSYITAYPSVNISGQVKIGECTELGTGSQIIQGKKIGQNVILGAGAVVIDDIPSECTAVGCPAQVIK